VVQRGGNSSKQRVSKKQAIASSTSSEIPKAIPTSASSSPAVVERAPSLIGHGLVKIEEGQEYASLKNLDVPAAPNNPDQAASLPSPAPPLLLLNKVNKGHPVQLPLQRTPPELTASMSPSDVLSMTSAPTNRSVRYIALKDHLTLVTSDLITINENISISSREKLRTLQALKNSINRDMKDKHNGEDTVHKNKQAFELQELQKKHALEERQQKVCGFKHTYSIH
jgi:hypothetical protein